jgi:acetate kinase
VAPAILTLNAGSSSIKFALFDVGPQGPAARASGRIEGIGSAPHMTARDAAGAPLAERRWASGEALGHEAFLGGLLDWIDNHLDGAELAGVGHRVVHGGARFSAPARVTPALMAALDALVPLAPLHQPHNLAAMRAVAAVRPGLPQVACFDTGFHSRQPAVATRFAIPRALAEEGIRRYGFHGLSYEYIARRLGEIDPPHAAGRVIVAHLGNGASLCAVAAGRSIDTTMGFTALDGLMMGTRSGAIDPGVLLYLLQQKAMTAEALSDLLYDRSGLLGVSGISSDMRVLLASPDPRAEEAVELFTYRIAREAGAMAASLGGLDGLVFTAGIGENAPEIRRRACERMAWLGIVLDPAANAANAAVISRPESRVVVRVIPTDEERMIAIHTIACIAPA